MNGIAVIKVSLETSQQWLTALMADVQETATTFPTPKGGNHPLWVLGHLIHSEAAILAAFIRGEPNPLAKWDALFGMGSTPVADRSRYPSVDELKAQAQKVRADTLRFLASCSDADLDRPSKAPEDLKDMFGTVGQCLVAVSLHQTFHAGQVADARRAAGLKPVFG